MVSASAGTTLDPGERRYRRPSPEDAALISRRHSPRTRPRHPAATRPRATRSRARGVDSSADRARRRRRGIVRVASILSTEPSGPPRHAPSKRPQQPRDAILRLARVRTEIFRVQKTFHPGSKLEDDRAVVQRRELEGFGVRRHRRAATTRRREVFRLERTTRVTGTVRVRRPWATLGDVRFRDGDVLDREGRAWFRVRTWWPRGGGGGRGGRRRIRAAALARRLGLGGDVVPLLLLLSLVSLLFGGRIGRRVGLERLDLRGEGLEREHLRAEIVQIRDGAKVVETDATLEERGDASRRPRRRQRAVEPGARERTLRGVGLERVERRSVSRRRAASRLGAVGGREGGSAPPRAGRSRVRRRIGPRRRSSA